jgi:hypothetical protein
VLVVENKQEVFTAMIALKEGLGARAGCTRTPTFDQTASRLAGFELVS